MSDGQPKAKLYWRKIEGPISEPAWNIVPHVPIREFVDNGLVRVFRMVYREVDDHAVYGTRDKYITEKLDVTILRIRTEHMLLEYDIDIASGEDEVFLRRELFMFDNHGEITHHEEEIWVADRRRLNENLLSVPPIVSVSVGARSRETVFRIRGYGTVFVDRKVLEGETDE